MSPNPRISFVVRRSSHAPLGSPPIAQGALHRIARSAHLAPGKIPSPPVTENPRVSEGDQSDLDRNATSPVDAVDNDIPPAPLWRKGVKEMPEFALLYPRKPGDPRKPMGRPRLR